jgi:hydroxyacylglutathione hydrolase
MLKIIPLPAFKDNYIWLLVNPDNRFCAIVDPGDAVPVLDYLQTEQLTPCAVLITHHHQDHSGGIAALHEKFPAMPIYGPADDNVAGVDHPVMENEVVKLPELNLELLVLDIPGHTLGHIAYYGDSMLFCGDTLFAAGCGRVFEGTPPQMYHSLQKLANLPLNTEIYCGHEYTAANLRFAATVEPDNEDIKTRIEKVNAQREQDEVTLPSTMQLEKLTNPFLRADSKNVISSVQQHFNQQFADPVSVFQATRAWKDTF